MEETAGKNAQHPSSIGPKVELSNLGWHTYGGLVHLLHCAPISYCTRQQECLLGVHIQPVMGTFENKFANRTVKCGLDLPILFSSTETLSEADKSFATFLAK